MKKLIAIGVLCLLTATAQAIPKKSEASKPPQCHVHQLVLQKQWVKILYGLMGLENDFMKAREKHFPFSNKVAYGGCVIEHVYDSKTGRSVRRSFRQVDYCPHCRAAESSWHQEKANAKQKAAELPPVIVGNRKEVTVIRGTTKSRIIFPKF